MKTPKKECAGEMTVEFAAWIKQQKQAGYSNKQLGIRKDEELRAYRILLKPYRFQRVETEIEEDEDEFEDKELIDSTKECPSCSKYFKVGVKDFRGYTRINYCSGKCDEIGRYEAIRAKVEMMHSKPYNIFEPIKSCAVCNRNFKNIHDTNHRRRVYCSEKCSGFVERARKRVKGLSK